MEEMLKANLREDEEILWKGKPESFETLDAAYKPRFIMNAVIGGVIALILIVLYAIAAGGVSQMKLVMVAIVVLLCAIPTINLIGDGSKLKKMEYVATNQRLIVMRDSVKGMDYSAISEAEFRKDAAGHTSLVCGEDALKAKPTKWREICIIGQSASEGDGKCVRFVMYAPENLSELKKILKDRLPCLK